MIAYDPAHWQVLFAAVAGASAALAGLLFVAASLNIKEILESPGLPPLAARTLQLLLGMLLLSIFALVPGQSRVALGIEVAGTGLGMVVLAALSVRKSHFPVVRWRWTVASAGMAAISTIPMLVAGISLIVCAGGGLYWALAELVMGFCITIDNAWILLIEIKR